MNKLARDNLNTDPIYLYSNFNFYKLNYIIFLIYIDYLKLDQGTAH